MKDPTCHNWDLTQPKICTYVYTYIWIKKKISELQPGSRRGALLTQSTILPLASLSLSHSPTSHLGAQLTICTWPTAGCNGHFLNWRTAKSFPCSSVSKESACSAGDPGLIPGLGRSPGEGNGDPLQYPCLENLMDRGAWWAAVHGVANSWAWLSD